ncbi:putative mucin/carbohydrate-binding domain-containing protein [Limosilactobacillus pulli]|uniref:putative mucin/carbohydrate-binding domain-containing protein n=1 Tax=Limosilactobacillus pulli TaxID=2991833 RepID=UPI0024BA4F82|nr:putative mucin/carbohydrate-binding domain-containing protein [Limosilactobacillus pulli]
MKASGQPHSYFPNAQYARVTVSRGAETLFDQTFIGDQSYRFNQTLQLQAGDVLSIEHAEAKTRYTTNDDATMKTSALGDLSRFVFVVANDLSLRNISDYAYLDSKTKKLIDDGTLAFGVSASDINTMQTQLDNQQADLTTEQKSLLQSRLDQAKELLTNTPNSINIGQTMTYQGFVLSPDTSITQTNKEGRYMGTYHDRQSLGMVLSDGSTIRIRRVY